MRQQAAPPSKDNGLTGLTILVVEDHADSRELLVFLLECLGTTVWAADTASEGLELLRRHRPDVVISDIGLPDEDGISLMRRVRSLSASEGGTTPAIALTALTTHQDRARILNAGFNEHLAKPVDTERLVKAVSAMATLARSANKDDISA